MEATMPILRLPKGSLRDEIRVPLYDTITLDSGYTPAGSRQFFSSVQGKPKSRTNLKANNILETAVSYRIQGLALDVENIYYANRNAIPLLVQNSSIRVRIGEKDYWEAAAYFAGGRLDELVSTFDANATHQRLGDQAVQAVMLEGKHVVDINPLQGFFVEWTVGDLSATETTAVALAANTRLHFLFSFKGLLRRPVQ
jgi:pantothenate kinase-related protein Tda10